MRTKNKEVEKIIEDIIECDLTQSLSESFNRYAKAVLSDRAIPDVRDGLKPVQRRIIYSMYTKGYTSNKDTVKSAKVVGDVISNYHPHGDASIYDATVRLSQDWKANIPLVYIHGNNGSIDNDPPAAYRYTEAKLQKIADYMVQDIDKETVDMCYTFDDKRFEPVVLPARFPNLLINGCSGIGIGFSTNIPPHNLNEIIEACIYRLEHKRLSVEQLFSIVKGPDFPTGGKIDDIDAIHNLYKTGQASFYVHSKAIIDENIHSIVITEIPYGVEKKQFVHDLDDKRIKDHIDNIVEIRDESTELVRIVIEIKPNASCQAVLNYLNVKGILRSTYSANMLALDKGHPKTMNLLEIIDAYIEHQREVITRRSNHILKIDSKRIEIVEGLLKARPIIDEIIAVAKNSENKADFKKSLVEIFNFTENQSEAIATLQLYRISKTDISALESEIKDLKDEIENLNTILNDTNKLDRVIINDLKSIIKEFSIKRRTEILDEKIKVEQVDTTQLILKEDCYVVLTRDGYIKRTSTISYDRSVNNNPLESLPKIKTADRVILSLKTDTHNNLICFTSQGNYIFIPVFNIPEAKWKEEGTHLNHFISLDSSEKIVSAYIISSFKKGLNVCSLTSDNKIKRSELSLYENTKITSKPLRNISLQNNDEVVKVIITNGDSDLVVINNLGLGSRFNENEVPLTNLRTTGVKAINYTDVELKKNPKFVDMISINKDEDPIILLLTDQRCGRLFKNEVIEQTKRLGAKIKFIFIGQSKKMNVCSLVKLNKKSDIVIVSHTLGSDLIDLTNKTYDACNQTIKETLLDKDQSKVILGVHEKSNYISDDTKVDTPIISSTKIEERKERSVQLDIFDIVDEVLEKK